MRARGNRSCHVDKLTETPKLVTVGRLENPRNFHSRAELAYKNSLPRLSLLFIAHLPTGACTRTNSQAHTTLTEAASTPLLHLSHLIDLL
jgi:hypothetical protein